MSTRKEISRSEPVCLSVSGDKFVGVVHTYRENKTPKGVNVTFVGWSSVVSLHQLDRPISRGSSGATSCRQACAHPQVNHESGDPEVRENRSKFPCNHNVIGFDIAMNDWGFEGVKVL